MSESADAGSLADTRDLYLTLLKRALLGTLLEGSEIGPAINLSNLARRYVLAALRRRRATLARLVEFDRESIDEGRGWPERADTMIGRKRLDNVQSCVEDVIRQKIPGDMIEAGVWRGGASILMRGVLRAHGIRNRRVWVADSFDGLPPPNTGRYPADRGDTFHEFRELAIPLDTVRATFERYGLLDDQVEFLKGWFRDTLPQLGGHEWAVIRLDGDMYESTMEGLRALYPGLSVGGYTIIDDYGALEPCRVVVTDFAVSRESTRSSKRSTGPGCTGNAPGNSSPHPLDGGYPAVGTITYAASAPMSGVNAAPQAFIDLNFSTVESANLTFGPLPVSANARRQPVIRNDDGRLRRDLADERAHGHQLRPPTSVPAGATA